MKFSCIIPAYNEWPRIANVLWVVLACEELDEIIVVDDGSTDNTWSIIDTFDNPKLQKIHLEKNGGKTKAVFSAIMKATGEYFVFIDSDLIWLKAEHISSLIQPIKNHQADVTLSLRQNSLLLYKWLSVDFVSGERVVPRSLFEDEKDYIYGPGFGLESIMNQKILKQNLLVKSVYLPIITPRKSTKMGWLRGTIADIWMTYDIVNLLGIRQIIYQNRSFSKMQKNFL